MPIRFLKLAGMAVNSRILVVGSINTDLVIRGPKLPRPGETVIGGEFYQAAGGKGANQAVAAARAALEPVTFVGAVGDDDLGRTALERFQSENLVCDCLKTVTGTASGVALILVDEQGQNLISVAAGANACLTPADIDALPDSVFSTARVFLTCLETPLETVARALERAKRAGLLTILNPAPAVRDVVTGDLLSLVDVVTPNAGEAALLTCGEVQTDDRYDEVAVESARELQKRGCRQVVVTLGAEGCLVVDRETVKIPGRHVEAVDATAAGDAFNGALAVAISEGRTLEEAARWANAAAAISVTRRGAQPSLATRREIDAFAS
ncbi:MAG TPA: ribokinase [Gemmataceae bacterium]|nr:ribokinase [Gemmataceae bacterium]